MSSPTSSGRPRPSSRAWRRSRRPGSPDRLARSCRYLREPRSLLCPWISRPRSRPDARPEFVAAARVFGSTLGSAGPPRPLDVEIPRWRLLSRLDERWDRAVTLLVAGPGFGKTTILAQALRAHLL